MNKEYNIKNPLTESEVKNTAIQAVQGRKILAVNRIQRGSTNLVFHVMTETEELILKISHRPDRIKQEILFKEAKILQKLEKLTFPIAIPKIIWVGKTEKGFPALAETVLPGNRVEDIINHRLDVAETAKTLGSFVATLHSQQEQYISEFENGRPNFPDFSTYAEYWLDQWNPILKKATHISLQQISHAVAIIRDALPLFSEKSWSYVHADISFENLHGKIESHKLLLTGLCDFENVQTAPPEYDFATIDDGLFIFYPQMEAPFFESYKNIHTLPKNFEKRLVTVNLFRSLRYIKRSVAYNETHYFAHDRTHFEKWLKKSQTIL